MGFKAGFLCFGFSFWGLLDFLTFLGFIDSCFSGDFLL